ncbi:MAG: PHP domain-containing protein [Clostridia bacterium]|nr:PHP domain-containing protein [Clostridia bacterium]
MELFADLHIHSCPSPCGEDDMTPCNLCGMAKIKGLDIIALTDHNTCRNLPAAAEVCEAYGLLLVPGMEITTKEEVHLLGYFPDVPTAMEFSRMIRTRLPKAKNRPSFFGNQRVMNSDDEQIDEEDALLMGATDLSLSEATRQVIAFGGVPVPAHINRGSHGLLVNLGMMPQEPYYTTVEMARHLPCDPSAMEGRHVLHSSDAHYLGDIQEREHALRLEHATVADLLEWMRTDKRLMAEPTQQS